eukprot:scaffold7340_cov266-Pinguiococcus_pyrenoidosus.AAC.44
MPPRDRFKWMPCVAPEPGFCIMHQIRKRYILPEAAGIYSMIFDMLYNIHVWRTDLLLLLELLSNMKHRFRPSAGFCSRECEERNRGKRANANEDFRGRQEHKHFQVHHLGCGFQRPVQRTAAKDAAIPKAQAAHEADQERPTEAAEELLG